MWWLLWLFHLLGLGGALTVWSLFELVCAIGTMLLVLLQAVGCFFLIVKWKLEDKKFVRIDIVP